MKQAVSEGKSYADAQKEIKLPKYEAWPNYNAFLPMNIEHFARAFGAVRAGKPDDATADIAKLAELRDKLSAAKDAYWAEQVEIERQSPPPGCSMRKVSTRRRSRP